MSKSVSQPPPDPFQGSMVGKDAADKMKIVLRGLAPPTNYIYIKFDPSLSPSKPKCKRIRFVQVHRVMFNDRPIHPADHDGKWEYMRPYTTPELFCVDFFEGSKDPYYQSSSSLLSGLGDGSTDYPARPAVMGDAPSLTALGGDKPFMGWSGSLIREGIVREMRYEFETFACCAAGQDCSSRSEADVAMFGGKVSAGTFYEGIKWTWAMTAEDGRLNRSGASTIVAQGIKKPSAEFLAAYALFLKVSGYKPCSA